MILQTSEASSALEILLNAGPIGAVAVLAATGFWWISKRHVSAMERSADAAAEALKESQARGERTLLAEVEKTKFEAQSRERLAIALDEFRRFLNDRDAEIIRRLENLLLIENALRAEHDKTRSAFQDREKE